MFGQTNERSKKHYITSLKGIACLLVAFGHFIGTVKYSSHIDLDVGWIKLLTACHLDFLISESFYLYLFFVVSGYLVAHSKVVDIKDLIVRVILRFLRLALPILAACFFIFLISKIIPFYSRDTVALFENSWLQAFYDRELSLVGVLRSPIDVLLFSNPIFNPPYWVLSHMMFASFLIYCATYIRSKITSEAFKLFLSVFLLLISFFWSVIVFSCIIGCLLSYYEKAFGLLLKPRLFLCLSGILTFAGCFISSTYGAIAFFAWLIIAIPHIASVQKALEIKPFGFFGGISFGIYSFHWPIFCSIGCFLMINLWNALGAGTAICIAILVSTAITLAVSVAFHYSAERLTSKILALVKAKLYTLLGFKKSNPSS